MDEFHFEIRRIEADGSRTCVRRERLSSRGVLRILGEWFREKLQTSAKFPCGRGRRRRRGRPGRSDITKALQLTQQGVPRKEIYKLLHITPRARHAFRQAFSRRKRIQERRISGKRQLIRLE